MLTNVTHILPLTTIRRERLLPVAGRVEVRLGQKVKPTDIVAEATLAPRHVLLDAARGLGLGREEADRLIERRAGEPVMEGDVLASRGGLARRLIRTPVSGQVVMVGDGQILIEAEVAPFQVIAGIPGTVVELIENRGAVIETTGALIQGAWGNRRIDYGVMRVVAQSPQDLLTPDHLDVRMRGSILLAGRCDQAETLEAAREMTLRGLILGSMEAYLVPVAAKLRFPVMVVEGFGARTLSDRAFKLLASNDNRDVVVNAQPYDRLAGTRPEIIIPLPAPTPPALSQDIGELVAGSTVRVTRAPYEGWIGNLRVVRQGLTKFPSGVRAPAARIAFENGETAMVPLANLELVQ